MDCPDKCKFEHRYDKEAKKKAEEREKKWKDSKNKSDKDKNKNKPASSAPTNKGKVNIPCKFYAAGNCSDSACRFLHGEAPKSAAGIAIVPLGVARAVDSYPDSILPCTKGDDACFHDSPDSVPVLVAFTAAPAVNGLALDSGAGAHLLNPSDLPTEPVIYQAPPVEFATANGRVLNVEGATVDVSILPNQSFSTAFRVMHDSPSVLSLGRLCVQNNFAFVWPPGSNPILILPNGASCEVPLQGFVPVLEQVNACDSDSVKIAFTEFCSLFLLKLRAQHQPLPSDSITNLMGTPALKLSTLTLNVLTCRQTNLFLRFALNLIASLVMPDHCVSSMF